MTKSLKKRLHDCNALIEGAYKEESRNTRWKLVKIDIPAQTKALLTPKDTYVHIGIVGEKLEFKLANSTGSTFNLEDPSTMPGFICPALDETISRPGRYVPRALCLKDGRVYVKAQLMHESTYMDEYLPALVNMAKAFFWHKKPIALEDFIVVYCIT